ncbi:MAG: glycosyltransferase [Robiginitomaculum sp.]
MNKMLEKIRQTIVRIVNNDPHVMGQVRHHIRNKASNKTQFISSKIVETVKGMQISATPRKPLSYFESSQLFSPDYYQSQLENKFKTPELALKHYKEEGWKLGLNPHPLFDTNYYLQQLKTKAILLGDSDPLNHFLKSDTSSADPHPLFNNEFYKRKYPWVSQQNSLLHYINHGCHEAHYPNPLFDSAYYIENNFNKIRQQNPLEHFVEKGWHAGLNPHPIFDLCYVAKQIDPELPLEQFTENPLEIFLNTDNTLNPHPYFNVDYYVTGLEGTAPALTKEFTRKNIEAIEIFLDAKTPLVDPSIAFSELAYKEQFPALHAMNGLYHYLRYGQKEGRQKFSTMLQRDSEDFRYMLTLELDIVAPHQQIKLANVVEMPRMQDPLVLATSDLTDRIGEFKADIIYLCPGFMKGGAEKYGTKLINALSSSKTPPKILVLSTDNDIMDTFAWFKPSPHIKIVQFDKLQLTLTLQERTDMLAKILIWCCPAKIINNNSHAGWLTYQTYGNSLSTCMKLTACLFCYEFDEFGQPVGYARDFIRETIKYLNNVFIDNSSFANSLIRDFYLGSTAHDIFQVLYQPFDGDLKPFLPGATTFTSKKLNARRPRVLWPARFVKQKNPAFLREIAIAMPKVDFIAWTTDKWSKQFGGGKAPDNLIILNDNTNFSNMAAQDMDAMLLTSDWEGLPTTLIEATTEGLPIIATRVGGVKDLIDNESGWLIEKNDVDGAVRALRECLTDVMVTADKVLCAQKHTGAQHSYKVFLTTLKRYGLINPKPPSLPKAPRPVVKGIKPFTLDATLVINGHKEGYWILPTLHACHKTVQFCLADNFSCELLIVLDNPDVETRQICEDFVKLHDYRIVYLNVKDLGAARNGAVREAKGEFIAFMDGDDMPSRNWVSQGIRFGRLQEMSTILHPSMNYIFGDGDTYIFLHCDMDSPSYVPAVFNAENYWTALSMAPREIYLQFPYEKNDFKNGLAYEDWSWNARTIASGIKHKVVPASAHYIRRKAQSSLLQQTNSNKALPRLYHLRGSTDHSTIRLE